MTRKKNSLAQRFRIGKVTIYLHRNAWWIYYRDLGQTHRRKIADDRSQAESIAAQVNAQLALQKPTPIDDRPAACQARLDFAEIPTLMGDQLLDCGLHALSHSGEDRLRKQRVATVPTQDGRAIGHTDLVTLTFVDQPRDQRVDQRGRVGVVEVPDRRGEPFLALAWHIDHR